MPIINLVYEAPEQWGWQPWANTIAYYPLNSTTTVNDLSWNWYNLTNVNNWILFQIYQWVDCSVFSNNNYYNALVITTWDIIPKTTFTYSAWLYILDYDYNPRLFTTYGASPYCVLLNYPWYWERIAIWSSTASAGLSIIKNSRHLYTVTWNFSTWQYIWYIDWVVNNSWSWNPITPWVWVAIWCPDAISQSWQADKYNGWMSNVIVEDKIRTAQEVSDYYTLTSWDYT